MIANLLGGYFVRRLVGSLVMLFIVMSTVFVADRSIGDPARMVLGDTGTEADLLELRERMGLEDPWHVQYGRFVSGMATFDFGETFRYGISKPLAHGGLPESRETLPIALERLPATFLLTGVTIALSVLIALPLGIYAAVRPRTLGDRLVNVLSLAGVSIVEYWFALILILVFAVQLDWLPTSGYGTAAHVILPALALSLRPIGRITQIARSSMLDELARPYVTAARGRGIPLAKIASIHALKNAAIPIVTTVGDETVNIITGVIIIETVFGWPGDRRPHRRRAQDPRRAAHRGDDLSPGADGARNQPHRGPPLRAAEPPGAARLKRHGR